MSSTNRKRAALIAAVCVLAGWAAAIAGIEIALETEYFDLEPVGF